MRNVTLSDGATNVTTTNVTGLRDWARLGGGGFNAHGNAIFYRVCPSRRSLGSTGPHPRLLPQVLVTAASLASRLCLPIATKWAANATALKQSYNEAFSPPSKGMYRDNITSTTNLCPQDGNPMAVLFNLTDSVEKKKLISTGLQKNWGPYGAEATRAAWDDKPVHRGFRGSCSTTSTPGFRT